MSTKPMSAVEYRANAEKAKANQPTEIVTLQSGSVFELRRPDLSGYIKTGRLPQSLVTQGVNAWREKKTPKQAAQDLDDKDVIESLIFMREIVHECTVNPKFVEFATNDNEIGAVDMLPQDFDEIYAWAMGYKGIAGIASLQSFREGSARGTSGVGANRKKLRRKVQQPVEAVGSVQ